MIIDRYNGILINPLKEELIDALKCLLDDPVLRNQIGNYAVSVAKTFSKQNWVTRWENVILGSIER